MSSLEQQLQWVHSKFVNPITLSNFSQCQASVDEGHLGRNHDDSLVQYRKTIFHVHGKLD